MQQRSYDVVLWGATGFTGRLVAAYLLRQYGLGGTLRWAIAGRSTAKLEALRAELQTPDLPVILADSQDRASLDRMASQTRVVCSCTGPYALYGSELVAACVAGGTHYCDLSGETPWMRRMIDTHHEAAQAAGVKIVHSCGFDSIPSDMGVFYLQQQALAQYGTYCRAIHYRLRAARGGFSGGTYASLSQVLREAYTDRQVAGVLADPYALNPPGERQGPDRPDLMGTAYDPLAGGYIGPFVMAAINTRIVRRSHALAGYPYGRDFRYDEATYTGGGVKGRLAAGMLAAVMGLVQGAKPGTLLTRLMDRWMPKPGEGPDARTMAQGFFKVLLYGELPDGQVLRATVTGDRDPGYGATSQMVAESAVCLAMDTLPPVSGVLTPAVAMGSVLLGRLEAYAGLRFSLDARTKAAV
ncbi:MAG: saccharopine dehydrogenase NADP-binding domain-containing protein [Bacteroidia bacterium]